MVGTAKQLMLGECARHMEIKGEDEARSGKGKVSSDGSPAAQQGPGL